MSGLARRPAPRVPAGGSDTGGQQAGGGDAAATGTGPRRTPLKDRVVSGLCLLLAAVVLVVAASRGSLRNGLLIAVVLVGYVAVQAAGRRLLPPARVLTGEGAGQRERLAFHRATRVAGWVSVVLALAASALWLSTGWGPGPWVAGALLVVPAAFVVSLVVLLRR
ncbi:hypothetical protein [Ornithinicoccus halotolerans]|uniref:hypothetical protein n=1 Tax=Ornithinicoccus halotolerans TaxID=1748220 RepID=UPI001295ECFB|nr:hypothetical protein [Ornithinicoccus halotolerans]